MSALSLHALSIDEQRDVLAYYYRSFAPDISLASDTNLQNTFLAEAEPLTLYDLNGQPLFYDFSIQRPDGTPVGVVRSSARGTEFPMLDAIMIGKQFFESAAARKAATEKVLTDYPHGVIKKTSFVCYGYPRVGILVQLEADQKELSVVYDAAMGYRVKTWEGPFSSPEAGVLNKEDEPEGQPFYSYLEQVPERGSSSGLVGITGHWGSAVSLFERSNPSRLAAFAIAPIGKTHIPRPSIRGSFLPVPLFGQKTPVYCAVATVQMILEYLGYEGHTQEQIAEAMETGPDGTTNAGMIRGFKKLTNNGWAQKLDNSPTFEKAETYLAQAIPAKTGIPQHARLLRGWREYLFLDPDTSAISHTERFYILNDPYPVDSGQFVMENVRKPTNDYFRNFLYPIRSQASDSNPIHPANFVLD